jgi:putative hemin transport protein
MESMARMYSSLKESHPHMHTREAADRLGVSEAQIVASLPGATRLRAPFGSVLRAMPSCGRVKTMTRNAQIVL